MLFFSVRVSVIMLVLCISRSSVLSNCFTYLGNSERKCDPAVHGQYGVDVVNQLRFHFILRPV